MSLFNNYRRNTGKIIPENKYRVIKISKDAVLEFLYESFNNSDKYFFDVSDSTTIVKCFDFDHKTGSFICVARSAVDDKNERLEFEDIDTEKLLVNMKDTTDSLYNDETRYIELETDQLINIQNIKGE